MWIAQLEHRNAIHVAGRFVDRLEAAKAYDALSTKLGRDKGFLNFPDAAPDTATAAASATDTPRATWARVGVGSAGMGAAEMGAARASSTTAVNPAAAVPPAAAPADLNGSAVSIKGVCTTCKKDVLSNQRRMKVNGFYIHQTCKVPAAAAKVTIVD